ncbi:sugar ABC transporter ATP-binding protein [Cryptosporangium arvum]|uniref:ABC-type sugar transport system, ATPase component n=1 Tax=Cryptosporangium arvum DSM 44712 TaxID=927661 RepID=A0A010ZV46_9ACTN|nr:sugar ABC transporter ATP-binding protein [Cryptosporangium arvum]EXG82569.1 ABC-type sugar transport system, ATPase component [Cryptosporangium arvum DSM 44712]
MTIRGLTKSYGTSVVLRGVDLDLTAGRIHALLGPNGAGKSTLLGCLSGAVRPDSGTIVVDGETHEGFTPSSALRSGTAIIYQHLELVDDLSAVENIFLGSELRTRFGTVRRREQRRIAAELLARVGADFHPTRTLSSLTMGQKQVVEIAKALRHQPEVLILDEPTAALSARETEMLLALVTRLAHESGLAIVYVTHLLREVTAIADEVSVLRDGSVEWTRPKSELTLEILVEAITGTPVTGASAAGVAARPGEAGPPVLELVGFRAAGAAEVSLTIGAGEVVGVFGLLGSGRTNLIEALAGARPSQGGLRLAGRPLRLTSPRGARRVGIALVPSDRKVQSLFSSLSAQENVLMPHYRRLSRWLRRSGAEQRTFRAVAERMSLHPMAPGLAGDGFSGGNAQKLVMGRWLMDGSGVTVLLLDEPTQGVDVGARVELHRMIREFARESERAVVFVSSDVEELNVLADRIVVLAESRVAGVVPGDTSERDLLTLAQPAELRGSAVA